MGNKVFGHVGDKDTITVEMAGEPPRFDKSQVDYLKKVFQIGGPCPFLVRSQDDATAVVAWTSMDQGQREVIAHIENLIANQKGAI